MKSLVIAEKPSVARDIARVLKCKKNGQGTIEGERYIVTWGLGHLVTLADPEEYKPEWKEWKMDVLPMMPKTWKLSVIRQTAKQYNAVKSQIHRKDVGEIIIATDAGREGELVARWILEKAGNQKPVKRLWISSVTDRAIREGFGRLRDGRDYQNLYDAARSRAKADWLVGINATRALTCKYNAKLTCGRVQTPTLALIANREDEIRSFRPKPYYGLKVYADGICFTWQDGKSGSTRSFDPERIRRISEEIRGERLVLDSVEKKSRKTYAPGLYDLTELQREANRRFGYSAKETLNIMQRLYEHHKVLTYPRTDSRYLSSDIVPTLKERIEACQTGPYRALARALHGKQFTADKRFVDDSKVSDHHAIIPTEQYVDLTHMTSEERKIYDLVVRRFLAVLYPPAEFEQISVKASVKGEHFAAKGETIREAGWRAVYDSDIEEEDEDDSLKNQILPELKKGQSLPVKKLEVTEGKTKPPAHYTEATLLTSMEKGGLGTVATRADIIEKLFNTFYMEKKGNDLLITSKGRQLLELVPSDLKKPELTARWEKELQKISDGRQKEKTFMKEIEQYTNNVMQDIRTSEATFRHDNLTNRKCPRCGKRMLAVNGKNSKLLVCQDRECGYRETVSRTTNARCPVCHKRMELVGKGEDQTFVCACGHKEKMAAFEARRKREGKDVSRQDVRRYMKQQQKEAEQPLNNAFAEALAKMKIE
ncbi:MULTISPECIES: DNA topoisomerase III [Oscillospiraceae]|uniref:DNA topoisomerase III n=1 Tax=Oscillospiraceae TaxID=216572 RepID=UPI000B36B83E|nr:MULTISPECIES: DNA topoisomerase III [Oscillospiraceae]OUN69115.1 DNA topoisomerase III [Drancourtella sp. An57]OUQ46384.1 DNA topoisomerase III [Drancourtella sp. An12]HIV94496.1 DNA topoisomerase III [Candidatus Sellimonas avistercoris]